MQQRLLKTLKELLKTFVGQIQKISDRLLIATHDSYVAGAMRQIYDDCMRLTGKTRPPNKPKSWTLHKLRMDMMNLKLLGDAHGGSPDLFTDLGSTVLNDITLELNKLKMEADQEISQTWESVRGDLQNRALTGWNKEAEKRGVEMLKKAAQDSLGVVHGELYGLIRECETYMG